MAFRIFWRLLVVLLLVGCSSQASAQRRLPAVKNARPSLTQLVTAPIPERDLYALTDELKLRPPRAIPHVIRTTSPNFPVGHQDPFYVLTEDKNHFFDMHATIRAKTPHLYFYVQNGAQVNQAALEKAAYTFEHSTYPTDRSFFGSEWTPGVDGDPHITCLIGDLKSASAAGYYSAEDEYPQLVNKYSNQREMIYLNSTAVLPGDGTFDRTLAHEFQHMIHWHMHPHDNAWLNEGMSMLAEYLNHYPPNDEARTYLGMPETQLTSWSLDGNVSIAHYGAAYLFLGYLYQRFGRGLIKDMLADRRHTDLALVNAALRKHHVAEPADQIFADWVVANYAPNHTLRGSRGGYALLLPHSVAMTKTAVVPFSYTGAVAPYGAQYIVLDALSKQRPFRLHFRAPSSMPLVGLHTSVPYWWSNRGDMSDTRLSRAVDLRHVQHATLHFSTWYDIEKDYDYGYVEVSRDGGKTWDTLRAADTTAANPNGANYGNAFTSGSKGWRSETLNLTAYVGHVVKLRFEYITDDEYNGQGWAIRHITIPDIGFHDDLTGWSTRGFVPVASNLLPSRWNVQLLAYTAHGLHVSKLPLSAADTGSVLIDPAKEGLTKLVVVAFTAVPKTTVKTSYTVSASSIASDR